MRKAILCVFALFALVWMAGSAYFLVAGRCARLPDVERPAFGIDPEENAFTHLKWLSENIPENKTRLFTDYQLRQAYLDGTTSRQELAEAAREAIAAESNTFACAERVVKCSRLVIPWDSDCPITTPMTRIANLSKLKAVSEASDGDVAKGRQTLMNVVKMGLMAMDNESSSIELSQIVGYECARSALDMASNPLFVNGDEQWRRKLRQSYRDLVANDVERAKLAVKWTRDDLCFVEGSAKNRAYVLALMLGGGQARIDFSPLFGGDFGIGGGNAFPGQKWEGVENRFLTVLLTAFPGYLDYAFQPSRCIEVQQTEMERFCRKINEPYDIKYAKSDFGAKKFSDNDFNPLRRNWLGENFARESSSFGTEYGFLFKRRFETTARIVASACESYKVKHGEYPRKLDALVPEFLEETPRDPYDGEPLRYNGEKAYLWTPGKDLYFDGKVNFRKDGKPCTTLSTRRCAYFIANPEAQKR